jgi:putative holliday junction resolvase
MAICNPSDLKARLRPGARLLGLDVGERTVGLAVSDPGLVVASPVGTLKRGRRFRDTLAELRGVAEERRVGALVVGWPVNMNGTEGPRCQSTRQFAENILAAWDVDIAFWDERLSTAAVERAMIAADLSRARRREKIDQAAAAYILQGFLDHLANLSPA